MSDENVTVLVAGDPSLRNALRIPHGDGVEVIGSVPTGNDAIANVLIEIPDVLLLDCRIEESDARAVCRRVREWAPATKILTASPLDDENAYTTMVAGATGAVLLSADDDRLLRSIKEVSRGEAVMLPRMARRVLHDLDAWAIRSADPYYPPPTLTATEREVLSQLGDGADPTVIAAAHGVTAHLVNVHAGFAVAKLHRYVHGVERIAAKR